jgi:hypothetical protein
MLFTSFKAVNIAGQVFMILLSLIIKFIYKFHDGQVHCKVLSPVRFPRQQIIVDS